MDYDEYNQRYTFGFDYSNIDNISDIKEGIYFIETHSIRGIKQELRPAQKRDWKQSDLTVRGRGWWSVTPWEVKVLKKGKDPRGRPFTRVTFKTWGHYLAHPPDPYKDKSGYCGAFMTLLYHEDIVAWELRPVGEPGTIVEAYEIVIPHCASDSPKLSENDRKQGTKSRETIGLFTYFKEGTLVPTIGPFGNTLQFRSWRLRRKLGHRDNGLFIEDVDSTSVMPTFLTFSVISFVLTALVCTLGVRLTSGLLFAAASLARRDFSLLIVAASFAKRDYWFPSLYSLVTIVRYMGPIELIQTK